MALAYSEVDTSIVEQAYARASTPRSNFGHANVGAIESEEGMGQVLDNKRDAIYAKAIPASVAQFDSVFDSNYRDWLNSGAQAIINERAAKWKEYYGDKTSVD
jgi:putative aldouronate transport system substrate-binding protein